LPSPGNTVSGFHPQPAINRPVRWRARIGWFNFIVAAMRLLNPPTYHIAVKAYTKRRPAIYHTAWFWIFVYGLIGVACFTLLAAQGFGYLLIIGFARRAGDSSGTFTW
jgi:hypothetical protein